MDQKQLIKTLEAMEVRMEKIQTELMQVKIDIASNKEVSDLKAKVAAMEVKMYIVFGFMALVVSGVVGFVFKTN